MRHTENTNANPFVMDAISTSALQTDHHRCTVPRLKHGGMYSTAAYLPMIQCIKSHIANQEQSAVYHSKNGGLLAFLRISVHSSSVMTALSPSIS